MYSDDIKIVMMPCANMIQSMRDWGGVLLFWFLDELQLHLVTSDLENL